MPEKNIARGDDLSEARDLWEAYRQVQRRRGIDLDYAIATWTQEQIQKLDCPLARHDFSELCRLGCVPPVLATILALFRNEPYLKWFWLTMMGSSRKREKLARALQGAAQAIEKAFGEVIDVENAGMSQACAAIGHIPPSRLVAELTFYSQLPSIAERLGLDLETRSVGEFAKYLLTSYIKYCTGSFRDRCVCNLLAQVTASDNYDDPAHRMWRKRNYARLDANLSDFTRFLCDMGAALPPQAA